MQSFTQTPIERTPTTDAPLRYSADEHRAVLETTQQPIVLASDPCDGCGGDAQTILPLIVPHPEAPRETVLVDVPLCTRCFLKRAPRIRMDFPKNEAKRLITTHGVDVDPYQDRPTAVLDGARTGVARRGGSSKTTRGPRAFGA